MVFIGRLIGRRGEGDDMIGCKHHKHVAADLWNSGIIWWTQVGTVLCTRNGANC